MDIVELDQALITLVEKKMELGRLSYADSSYDEVEEELHDLEDAFVDKYGDYLESVFEGVHDKHCPDSDVLLPTAYLANKYLKTGQKENGSFDYDVANYQEGVVVDSDFYDIARLVLIPNPARIVLFAKDGAHREDVWVATK